MAKRIGYKLNEYLLELAADRADGLIRLTKDFLKPSIRKSHFYNKNYTDISRQNIYNSAKRLQENGYLEKIKDKNKVYYKITIAGRKWIDRKLFDREKWDGKWRIVMYDVPEEEKRKREYLRRKLVELGFKQLQRSVWVSPFDVLDDVKLLVEENNLHNNFWYFWADSFTNDEEIIEKFLKPKK